MRIAYREVERETTPLGELSLHRYEGENGEVGYEVRIDDRFLMASHGAHSERAMAELAYERLGEKRRAAGGIRVLVGGLGAGHTLRAALDLPGIERVDVVEIGGRVVEWNRRYFGEVNDHAVDDPRTHVHVGDLAAFLENAEPVFDLMLLDVDNGPGILAAPGNARLYEAWGLSACRDALRSGGILAIWSPTFNPTLEAEMRNAFGAAEAVDTSDLGRPVHEPGDVIYLAARDGSMQV